MSEANEEYRIKLGEIVTKIDMWRTLVIEHYRSNNPVNPERIQQYADAAGNISADLADLADDMNSAEHPLTAEPMNLHGIPEAIGTLYPITSRIGDYMGIDRTGVLSPETIERIKAKACPECFAAGLTCPHMRADDRITS